MVEPRAPRPLVLDVDGTLIRSDLTHELLLEGVKAAPWKILRYGRLGLVSKSRLKEAIVSRVGDRIAAEAVPLEPRIVALAKAARAEGRPVYLCSGSEQSLVKRLADSLDFITDGFGTTPDYNMTSQNKAAFLQKRFPDGFDYAGNSTQDYAVWETAHTAIAIRPPKDTPQRRSATGEPVVILEDRRTDPAPLLRALGLPLWVLNALILLAPLLGQGAIDGPRLALGFVALGLMSSGIHLLDGAFGVHRDRLDPSAASRPFAAGRLSIPAGLVAAALCLSGSLAISMAALPSTVTALLLAALLLTTLVTRILPSARAKRRAQRVVQVLTALTAGWFLAS